MYIQFFICVRLIIDLGFVQLLNPNWWLELLLSVKEIIENTFCDISITLTEDLTKPHSLSQPLVILRADNVEIWGW